MKIVTVEQMRGIEAASDAAGHTYAAMMERAGRATANALMARLEVQGKRILVLVGPGNNGGDGLVAARYLAQAGAEVACYLTRPRDPQKEENMRHVRNLPLLVASDDPGMEGLLRLAAGADVIVDSLLGTGSTPPVRGTVADVLRTVREALERRTAPPPAIRSLKGAVPPPAARPLILAVDGPSGLDFDTGALDEAALPADLTVTFAYPKVGHFSFPGAAAAGELLVADIGTDPDLAAEVELEVVTPEMVRAWLPPRPLDAHKGTFGRALVVAGSANYTGAARLAGAAAVRSGAGLVTIALPAPIHTAVAAGLPEATYLLLPHELGVLSGSAAPVLARYLAGYDALLIGPGLGRERETAGFVAKLLGNAGQRMVGFLRASDEPAQAERGLPPLVVDADGLNILSAWEDWPARLPPGTVLTPHPGEMARLMGGTSAEVQADRVQVARRYARMWGHVVLLKGAYTVVASPAGGTVIEPFANPGLASGGTGDVLAGVIVALLAQGVEPFRAAVAGAYLHGLAGELARQKWGMAGMAAGDLIPALTRAWQRLGGEKLLAQIDP